MVLHLMTVYVDSVHDILQGNVGACCVNVGLSADHDLDT